MCNVNHLLEQSMSPPLIQKTWDTAEDTVNLAARYALPVVQTFEKPINAVDSLACKTLDKVEETLPMVNKTPNEVQHPTIRSPFSPT